jgi:uncharacterized protein YbaR (Trm112 family)
MVSKEVLDILACPQCKGEIILHEQEQELVCAVCKLAYPIKEDIPVMLIAEARKIS